MFSFCAPEEADAEHQRLLAWEKEFIDALEIPYQVLELAAGDLGLSAARKYDCYGWLPTQDRYREITSTSNCTEFQARRLNIRARFAGGIGPVATLNGTLCAMTRTIIMILENHQQADGSVRVPAALRPFLGGREALTPALIGLSLRAGWRPRLVALRHRRHRGRPRRPAARTAVGDAIDAVRGGRGAGRAGHRTVLARGAAAGRRARAAARLVGRLQRRGGRQLPAGADRQGGHLRPARGDRAGRASSRRGR